MSSLRRALWGLAAAGLIFGFAVAAIILSSDHIELPYLWMTLTLVVGWGFIGVGLFAWDLRPENRLGSLMVATGFAWFLGMLGTSDLSVFFTVGNVFGSLFLAFAIHMMLSAPSGRLRGRGERRIVTTAYLISIVGVFTLFLFVDPQDDFDCAECPDNFLLVSNNDTVLTVLGLIVNVVAVVLTAAVLVRLIVRWRDASRNERRLFAPLYGAGIALMLSLMGTSVLSAVSSDSDTLDVIWIAAMAPFALVPYLLLAAFVRSRMAQGGAVGELIARLGEAPRPGELRDACAKALDDPTLELVYWLPERETFVDAQGRPFELTEHRAMAKVERDDQCVAAIVYDASLGMPRDHVRAVGAAAALALENERLDAELRAKVTELRASRERMLRVGLEERRRLERDLHDGAQQRLVSMALHMRLARAKLHSDPATAEHLLAGAVDELDAALEELRELARGIHPAVLSDRGLDTALETLAQRAPLPVDLASLPGERLPEAVELAAYYVVAEALTNVAKYAEASQARVDLDRDNGRLVVRVTDDGVGGADPAQGTGLRGLADRLAVIEGRLEVVSERGRGTTITARIPCG